MSTLLTSEATPGATGLHLSLVVPPEEQARVEAPVNASEAPPAEQRPVALYIGGLSTDNALLARHEAAAQHSQAISRRPYIDAAGELRFREGPRHEQRLPQAIGQTVLKTLKWAFLRPNPKHRKNLDLPLVAVD